MSQISENVTFPWSERVDDNHRFAWAGDIDSPADLPRVEPHHTIKEIWGAIDRFLSNQRSCFALIIETETHCVALVDHVRSYPIYFKASDPFALYTDVRSDAFKKLTSGSQDPCRTVEFLLCGYVLGRNTLFKNISSLQAGESLVVEKRSATLELNSHFQYFPSTPLPYPESTLIEMFGEVLDRAFRRVCSLAKGRPIWVPLSGGLDSRLILCKLIEHKYPHVSTFSYGINRNSDMTRAKQVAKALGVPWLHCPSRVQQLPTLYQSSIRKAYTDYAWGAHAVPVWMDFEAIAHLRRENIMTQDSVIVNGYSGDFLFGGHIPASLISEPTLETLVSSIISKHCSHFEQGVFDSQQSRIAEQIRRNFLYDHGNKTKDVEALCSFYESWDWRERQVKAVVNGQRLYDCCGLKWLLPLWDKELVDFWARIPLNQRAHQKLHIAYLKKYNFRGQFSTLRAPNKLWPLHLRWTPILGNVIQLFSSRKTKLGFYRFMFFFGVHRFQLGLFGCGFFAKHVHYLRHPYVVPIAAIKQLQDVRLELPSEISQNR